MLHDNRHRIRKRIEVSPEARQFGAKAYGCDRMVEFVQPLTDCPQFGECVSELGANLAEHLFIAHADGSAGSVPDLEESQMIRSDEWTASFHGCGESMMNAGYRGVRLGGTLERIRHAAGLLCREPEPDRCTV
jgi:hypothetical protein